MLVQADHALVRSALRAHRVQDLLKQLAIAVNKNVAFWILISVKVMFQQRPEEGAAIERLTAGVENLTAHVQGNNAAARRSIVAAGPLHCVGKGANNLRRYAQGWTMRDMRASRFKTDRARQAMVTTPRQYESAPHTTAAPLLVILAH